MTTKNRVDILIFVSCILAPYLSTILLIRIVDYSFLFLLPTYLIALIGLIITTKRLRKAEQNKKKKNVFLIISISAVLTFFFTYYTQQNIADFLSFKWKENSLIEFVNNIKSYKKITTLSDEYENLNGYATIPKNNTNIFIELSNHLPLEEVQKKYNIDNQHYEQFRQLLKSNGFRQFVMLEDGTILFSEGGMINMENGLAYSENGKKPTESEYSRITNWTKISEHWYAWAAG